MEHNIKEVSLISEIQNSYLEYSLASIIRAIPDYRDGLLPVYRRILWGAKDNFQSHSKHKKSAKLSGEIMGNFHPHSDNYGSIVSLTTTYNNNYPLMDGQGSFGDSTSPAASSRYTEVRLQKFTEEVLLKEIESLELKPNYDGTNKEPTYLNAKLPILLLRGSHSISVGYATNIPQYNLNEISEYLLGKTKVHLLPDFPTGCDIISDLNNPNNIIMRAKILNITNEIIGKRKKKEYLKIEFINLPFGTNVEKIGEQIRKLAQTEKILHDDIIAVNDLSDRNGDCLEVVLCKEREVEILSTLWKYTDLQSQFSINFTILVDGIPKTMDPISYLDLWKKWRIERISLYHKLVLEKLEEDSKLLNDIILVLSSKKDLIEILDNDLLNLQQCREKIKSIYNISNESIDFFLNLPIKKLIHLEIQKYKTELKEVETKINLSKSIIKNPLKQFEKEILKYSKDYGLERKSKIIPNLDFDEDIKCGDKNKIVLSQSFSIDKNKGIIIKGSEYVEPILAICSNGKVYRLSPNIKKKPIENIPIKVLYIIKESDRNNSNDILELRDESNKLGKAIKIKDITATSKGTSLGFESISVAKINNKTKLKISNKTSKPKKYA